MLRLALPSFVPIIFFHVQCGAAEPTSVQTIEEVVFGGANYYPPFYYQIENGDPRGFDIELFRAIGELTGWQTSFHFDRWEEIQASLASGSVDIAPMFMSEARRDQYLFSDPIFIESHFVWGNTDDPSHSGLESLAGYSIAAENGAYSLQELRRLGVVANVVETDSEAEALRFVALGIVDYAIIPANVAIYTIRQETLNVEAVSPPILPIPYAYAINPQKPALADAANQALDILRRSGRFAEIQNSWLFNSGEQRRLPVPYWTFPLTVIAGLLLFTLFAYRRRLAIAHALLETKAHDLSRAKELAFNLTYKHPLTNLPRREYFQTALANKIRNLAQGEKFAVGIFELQDLGLIQQAAGHDEADNLIKFIALNLSKLEGNSCSISISQFAYLFENVQSAIDGISQVNKFLSALSRDSQHTASLEPEIVGGVVLYPDDQGSPQDLLRKANIALIHGKSIGQKVTLYDETLEPYTKNLGLLRELRKTIGSKNFTWCFQPQFNVVEGRFASAEMLIRWDHPDLGSIPPDTFVPLAEQSGLINEVTQAVIFQAIEVLNYWKLRGINCRLSINISANDLIDAKKVESILSKVGTLGPFLTFEITETAVMKDVESIIKNVELVKRHQIALALDDYGTGYSSLAYLKEFNFDEIKIDQRFIKGIVSSERDKMLTKASIRLGHDLGAVVVAEGVEDLEAAKLLIDYGCDVLQGYAISQPLEHQDFVNFISRKEHNVLMGCLCRNID